MKGFRESLGNIYVFTKELNVGGTEIVNLNLAKGLIGLGYEVVFTPLKKRGGLCDKVESDFKLIEVGMLDFDCKPVWFFSIFRLAQVILFFFHMSFKKNDVLLLSLFSFEWYIFLAYHLTGCKARIITIQHLPPHGARARLLLRLFKLLKHQVVFPGSEAMQDLLSQRLFDPSRTFHLPNAVFDSTESLNIQLADCFLKAPRRCIIAARLVKVKGVDLAIEAFSQVALGRKDLHLFILGDGTERLNLEKLADKKNLLNKQVHFLGIVKQVRPYLSKANLLILSSHERETLPTVIIESLSVGCPVVSTRCKYGPSELLENGRLGILVPPGDSQSLAQGILDLLEGTKKFDSHSLREASERFEMRSAARDFSDFLAWSTI